MVEYWRLGGLSYQRIRMYSSPLISDGWSVAVQWLEVRSCLQERQRDGMGVL